MQMFEDDLGMGNINMGNLEIDDLLRDSTYGAGFDPMTGQQYGESAYGLPGQPQHHGQGYGQGYRQGDSYYSGNDGAFDSSGSLYGGMGNSSDDGWANDGSGKRESDITRC